jgi:hypothetical protein
MSETYEKLFTVPSMFQKVSQTFTSVVNVFMKLVKHFVLFKFVSIMFQFSQKREQKVSPISKHNV